MSERLGLTLSGGGFRATLFHLGVIEELRNQGRLGQVRHVTGVSGGAITAAHFWLHWEKYVHGTDVEFESVASEIEQFAQSRLQEGLISKWIWKSILGLPADTSEWLIAAYHRLFRGATLGLRSDIPEDDSPRLSILATNQTNGMPVAFDSTGVFFVMPGGWEVGLPQPAGTERQVYQCPWHQPVSLAQAVAASSAFPLLISNVAVQTHQFRIADLTDGGVFDNLGVVWMEQLNPSGNRHQYDRLLVSDAGARRSILPGVEDLPVSNARKLFLRSRSAIDLMMRHLEEQRHAMIVRPCENFRISVLGNAPFSENHPSMQPTTFCDLGPVVLESLRNHGRFVVSSCPEPE